VVRERRSRPYLAWGWLWYLGTLAPVIGVLQVGGQAMADRYTYVPLIGLFVAFVWGLADVAAARRIPQPIASAVAVVVIAACAVASWRQAAYWRDSLTLHRRSLDVTASNWKAAQGLCDAFLELRRYGEALAACDEAIRFLPTFPEAWQTKGVVLARMGEPARAIPHFQRALQLRPGYLNAQKNLGAALGNLGEYRQAATCFEAALRIQPDDAEAWEYLAIALARDGDPEGSRAARSRLRALDPARADSLRTRIGD
jgi:tetratricopeptide (TPR) repeat protein